MTTNSEIQLKVVVIGWTVGKTCLVERFVREEFNPQTIPTIGVQFVRKTLSVFEHRVILEIWDTAAAEGFQSMNRLFCRGCHGIMAVYDVTNKESLNIIEDRLKDLDDVNVPRMLVGNQIDRDDRREVSTEEGRQFAEEHSMSFSETSALTNEGVTDAFQKFVHTIIHSQCLLEKSKQNKAESKPPARRSGIFPLGKKPINETPRGIFQNCQHKSCAEFMKNVLKEENINDYIKQNNKDGFIQMYNSFIDTTPNNATDLYLMQKAIDNKNNTEKMLKIISDRNIDDSELIFLTNLLGVTRNKETVALIKECILYKCIRDHHAEGFNRFCTADTLKGQHKIIESSFLEIAAKHGSCGFIEKILKRTIYDAQTWNQAVNVAQQNQYDMIVKDIKERECMIVTRSRRNFSLLHTAVSDNDEDMVEYILEKKIVDPNINHKTVGTALALAHSLCHSKCIIILQQYNVNTNTQNKFGETPLHEAIASGTHEQCEYLIERCDDIDKKGFNHLTALHCAVIEGCADICTQLIQKGADCTRYVHFTKESNTNEIASVSERTFLPLSNCENSLTLCLKFNRTLYPCFLQQMDVNKSNCCDSSKQSLLHLAALSLQPDICKSLLEAKALVNELNEKGNTCLLELLSNIDYSTDNNNNNIDKIIDVVKILIEFGADINVKTRSGQTVFQWASKYHNEKLVMTLLMKQIDRINITEDHFQWSFSQHWSQYPQILINLLSQECLSTFITVETIQSVLNDYHSHLIKSLFDNANENVQQSVIEDILMRAARNDDKDLFDYFSEKDIVQAKLFDNGETLFTNFLKDNNMSFCWRVIESKHIRYYANMRNINDQLPLQVAIEMKEMTFVDALISDTKDINNEDRNGKTALIQLLKKISNCNDEDMNKKLFVSIKSIIKRGGDIYMRTSLEKTTIDYCNKSSVRKKIEQVDSDHREECRINNEKTNDEKKNINFRLFQFTSLLNKDHREECGVINERINEEKKNICPVCLDNEIDCVFECGHTFCMECSEELFKCPLCQHEPTNPKRIYIN